MFDENEKKELLNNLQSLGLKEKEALVYLSLLELGEVGSSKVIKSSALHGQYVYMALESLENKGLVQHVIKQGRKKFMAKNPSTLVGLIERQKNIADKMVDKLKNMVVLPAQQQFEIYQGKDSFIAYEFGLLEKALENSQLLIIGGTGDDFFETMRMNLQKYEKIRLEKNIVVRYIGSEGQKKELLEEKNNRKLFEYRILPGLFTGIVNTNIWQDAIGFNIFGNPVTAFSISNSLIAISYRQFFESLWELGNE